MRLRLVHPEGYAVENPSEFELRAAMSSLTDGRQALTVYRSSIQWLRVERGAPNRFYLYKYSLWSVGRSVQPVSQGVAEKMVLAYATGERAWSGSTRFTNPKGKEPITPNAEEGSPEMWRQVATVGLENELARTPEKLRMLVLGVVFCAFLLWSGSALDIVEAALIAAATLVALVSYAAWTFKQTGQELERISGFKAS